MATDTKTLPTFTANELDNALMGHVRDRRRVKLIIAIELSTDVRAMKGKLPTADREKWAGRLRSVDIPTGTIGLTTKLISMSSYGTACAVFCALTGEDETSFVAEIRRAHNKTKKTAAKKTDAKAEKTDARVSS